VSRLAIILSVQFVLKNVLKFLKFLVLKKIFSCAQIWVMFLLYVGNRYKEYMVAKEQKVEMLKAIDDKLNECERFNKAHEVVCSIHNISICYFAVSPLNIQGS